MIFIPTVVGEYGLILPATPPPENAVRVHYDGTRFVVYEDESELPSELRNPHD